jgi:AcrR family transcriptional regulator
MTPVPRGHFDRSARKAHNRTRLLEAAARVYARRGIDVATLDDVAAEAGFSKGAVYSHFGNKENLLRALLEEHLTAQLEEQVELFHSGEGVAERPRAGADHWMAQLDQSADEFRLYVELWVHAQRDPKLRREFAERLDQMRSTFARLAEETSEELGLETSPGGPEQVANMMVGASHGLAIMRLADPEGVPKELLGATLALLVEGLTSSSEARDRFVRASLASRSKPRRRKTRAAAAT